MDNDDAEPEADPYTWNTGLTFNYRGIISNGRNIERFIKDSHFAIVMDFGKLKKSEFQTRTHTKHGREDNKVGALSPEPFTALPAASIEGKDTLPIP